MNLPLFLMHAILPAFLININRSLSLKFNRSSIRITPFSWQHCPRACSSSPRTACFSQAKLRESEDRIASIQRTLPVDKQLASIDPDSTELETDDSRIHFEETPRVRSSDSLSNEIDLSDLIDRLVGPQRVAKQVLIDSLSDQDEFFSPAISELSRKRGR